MGSSCVMGALSLRHTDSLFAVQGLSSCSTQAELLCGMWDLSSLTRDQTHVLCIARVIPNHWTVREVPRQHIKKQRYYFTNKGLSSQGYAFSQ